MSLRRETPCDWGVCPYDAEYHSTCEYWCGADEPVDIPEIREEGDENAEDEREKGTREPDEIYPGLYLGRINRELWNPGDGT